MTSREVALRVEMLPASYGDCLVVSIPTSFTMVVDTGPGRSTLRRLRERLQELPLREDGRRHVDLLVLTHIDNDHIANAAALLSDAEYSFGDVWFNGRDEVLQDRGTVQADAVSEEIRLKNLPHNRAFQGGAAVVPEGPNPWLPIDLGSNAPRITLLSPGPAQLEALARKWEETLARFAAREADATDYESARGTGRLNRPPIDLTRLAKIPYVEDDSVPNASSIAFLVEHRGASLLLTGDGVSSVYGKALARLIKQREAAHRQVHVVKLAHHGSKRNTQPELTLFQARHYLVSSDNKIHGLPDDETIARLVTKSLSGPTFWFNYATPLNLRWRDVATASGAFAVRYPQQPGKAVVLDLPVDE